MRNIGYVAKERWFSTRNIIHCWTGKVVMLHKEGISPSKINFSRHNYLPWVTWHVKPKPISLPLQPFPRQVAKGGPFFFFPRWMSFEKKIGLLKTNELKKFGLKELILNHCITFFFHLKSMKNHWHLKTSIIIWAESN